MIVPWRFGMPSGASLAGPFFGASRDWIASQSESGCRAIVTQPASGRHADMIISTYYKSTGVP